MHNFDRRSFIKAVSTLAVIGSVEPFLNRGVLAAGSDLVPPPDLFDPGLVDLTFWLQPRTLEMVRPQSGERLNITYWKDGHLNPIGIAIQLWVTKRSFEWSIK